MGVGQYYLLSYVSKSIYIMLRGFVNFPNNKITKYCVSNTTSDFGHECMP